MVDAAAKRNRSADTDQHGRYTGFSFGQPSENGMVDHLRHDAHRLTVDVGCLYDEMKDAVMCWARSIAAHPSCAEARNVKRNLSSLVKVSQGAFPVAPSGPGGAVHFVNTLKTS